MRYLTIGPKRAIPGGAEWSLVDYLENLVWPLPALRTSGKQTLERAMRAQKKFIGMGPGEIVTLLDEEWEVLSVHGMVPNGNIQPPAACVVMWDFQMEILSASAEDPAKAAPHPSAP